LLFGAVLVYGATGSLRTDVWIARLSRQVTLGVENPLAVMGSGLVLAGLGVPLVIVPFHSWLTGIYRGTRTPAGILIALILPGTAIVSLGRLAPVLSARTLALLSLLGSLSILWGYWRALRSALLRDGLAGIATAQSGLLLLALIGLPTMGWSPLFYVLVSNGLNLLCLWALDANARRIDGEALLLTDIVGLGRRRPWLAGAVTLCVLNIAGMPPLSGWTAQMIAARAATAGGAGWVIGLSIAGMFLAWLFAGRWLHALWMRPTADRAWTSSMPEIAVVAVVSAAGTLLIGTYAGLLLGSFTALAAAV
jgi:NADH-quinone oxidoreductase subunit N